MNQKNAIVCADKNFEVDKKEKEILLPNIFSHNYNFMTAYEYCPLILPWLLLEIDRYPI